MEGLDSTCFTESSKSFTVSFSSCTNLPQRCHSTSTACPMLTKIKPRAAAAIRSAAPIRLLATQANNNSQQLIALNKPTYNTRQIVSEIEDVLATAAKRELPSHIIEKIKQIPEKHKAANEILTEVNDLLFQRNNIQKQIKAYMKEKRDIEPLKAEQIENRNKERELTDKYKTAEAELHEILESVPNSIDPSVSSTEQIVNWLNPRGQYIADPKLEHQNIAQELGILDLKQASVVSGNSWYYLLNDGALLEQALVQYALKLARQHGFKMALPPSMVRSEVSNACGFKPRDTNNEQQTYSVGEDGKLCLTGTAEIPLAGLGINKTFQESELPHRVVGLSRSYRAEAGARGKDTKGIYRVHEFTKVELFVWSTQTQSVDELEKLKEFQMDLIRSLGLSAKVINMPYNDLGAPAYKKYDIEAWMPGRGTFGEVTSCSNCTDFQSRRLQTKYKSLKEKKSLFVHTLNGTAMAVPRVIVAILENFYDKASKRVAIPKVLQAYMDDKQFIVAEKSIF
ncbi:hypothetical protein WICPIJ_003546 [Wickerhamomyces pijperi]|uniref:serine--tRNA ligase n=1 Tax=Wickerhamomyces pijperi TaxID=599730 RepID=A0A9P8Q770_WICPI|nr:hypothetical protein WICPIJ_003546 [Wickerhamomyces pijperi]